MNLYFLVEGLAELKVYPIWIEHLTASKLTRCVACSDVSEDEYVIFEAGGAGKMKRRSIADAMGDIADHPVFDFFVVVIDAEENPVFDRVLMVQTAMRNAPVQLPPNCRTEILVQRVCFETWLCGHTDHFLIAKISTNRNVQKYIQDYDMENLDPEAMPANPRNRAEFNHLTIGIYHFNYLHFLLQPQYYSKRSADTIINEDYLNRLVQRKSETPSHLDTFGQMLAFLQRLNLA